MSAPPEPIPFARLADLATSKLQGVVRVPLFSACLGLRRWFGLQLPPGYQPGQQLPLVYLFRGHHSEWFNPHEDGSREGTFPAQAREAMARDELPPAVLVMPCLGSDDRHFQTIGADWLAPHLAPAPPGMGLGRFESHLVKELIPRIERALELESAQRLAIGFSLGGLAAFALGWRHPGVFSQLAAYDGSFFHDPIDSEDRILHHPIFDPVFGQPRDPAAVRPHSPQWLARTLPLEVLKASRYLLQSGPASAEPLDANHDRTLALVQALQARGVANQVEQVVETGHHNWKTADEFAMRSLRVMLG